MRFKVVSNFEFDSNSNNIENVAMELASYFYSIAQNKKTEFIKKGYIEIKPMETIETVGKVLPFRKKEQKLKIVSSL